MKVPAHQLPRRPTLISRLGSNRIRPGLIYYDSIKGKTNIYSMAQRYLHKSDICKPHKDMVKKYCLICDLESTRYYIFSTGDRDTSYVIGKPMLLNTLWYTPLGKEIVARKI